MPQNRDPRLKKAMKKIAKIMRNNDVGGFIHLVSPSHAEYKLVIDTTWSVASFEQTPDGSVAIRFRHRSKTPEKSDQTAHLIFSTRDMCALMAKLLFDVSNELEKKLEVTHKPFGKNGITPT